MNNITYKIKLQNQIQEIGEEIEDLEFRIKEDLPRRIEQLKSKKHLLINQVRFLDEYGIRLVKQ